MTPVYDLKLRRSIIRQRWFCSILFVFDVAICVFALVTGNPILACFDAFFAGVMLMLAYINFRFFDLNPKGFNHGY